MSELNPKRYKDFQGILAKKHKCLFRNIYLLTFKNGRKKVRVYGGDFEKDKEYTIGYIGYTLINIRPGKFEMNTER